MGLDQYASFRTGKTHVDPETNERVEETEALAYWRKHPSLQGFMENLYHEKGGEGELNAPAEVELDMSDIDTLEANIKGDSLPETAGFLFGDDSSEYHKEYDLDFCDYAREALTNGKVVIYSSWY